jgi:CDP-4-dehydro-6-deoxyglucose reductase
MSYQVQIQSSGKMFQVNEGEFVLDAALRQGISLPYGCRGGSCGSCRGRLVEGTVTYGEDLPPALTPEEEARGDCLFCTAQPRSDLVIEAQELETVADIPVRTLPCRVERKEQLAHDVMRLYLKLPQTERLRFLAGQYIDILLQGNKARAFSLANAPHDDERLELHLRHVPGGTFTHHVFHEMKEKALLRIKGPMGTFYLREDSDRPIIFMAGGTGFAPIKGIIEHAIAEGIRREMHLYWGARARRDLYLDDLARAWAEDHPHIHYVPVLSEPAAEDRWEGRTGFVHEAVVADFPDLAPFQVYASGPPVMVNAGRDAFLAHGLPEDQMFSDAFEYAAST